MRVTYLTDLVLRREAIPLIDTSNRWYKLLVHYSRSLTADELVAVSEEALHRSDITGEPLDWSLKPIGIHPSNPFFAICSRSDSGLFWRTIATVKYGMLVVECWLKDQLFRWSYSFLRSFGMIVCLLGEVVSRKHLRLDWLLITTAIASTGLIGCCLFWLHLGDYRWSILCAMLSLQGLMTVGVRRNQLVEKRDLEEREAYLRAFFRRNDVVPDRTDFHNCLMGLMEPEQIVAPVHNFRNALADAARMLPEIQAMRSSSIPCLYYNNDTFLRCAVHPDRYANGACNEQCPSFTKNRTDND